MGNVGEDEYMKKHLEHQLSLLRVRSRLLVSSLRLAYLALGGFAFSALIAVIGGALGYFGFVPGYRAAGLLGILIGVVSVTGLSTACAFMIRETTMAIDNLAEEAELYSMVKQKHAEKN
jgi:hypothetical protein